MNTKKMILDDSKAITERLDSCKSRQTRDDYKRFWNHWITYCQEKGLPKNGSVIPEDMKKRRLSSDQKEKYFYDNEVVKFFKWVQTDFKGKIGRPLTDSSALSYTTPVRSFFAYQRYTLEVQKARLPTIEEVQRTETDHAFDIYQLREMSQYDDLTDRTILSCGEDLWLRGGDFAKIRHHSLLHQ
jgi:hypothetical protein